MKGGDGPPPGGGFTTTIRILEALATARSDLGPMAYKVVELTNSVSLFEPFHCTVEAAVKFPPLTMSTADSRE